MSAADRSHLARSFDTVAGEYDRGRPVWPRAAIDWLLGPEPLDVLDVGAGTGKLTAVIAAAGHRVTAVEPMPRMREQLAARLPDVPRIAACAEQLPFAQDTFDAVLAGAAFHWFDAERALAEFARVLRPGGVVGMLGNVFDVGVPGVARLREILGPPAAERRDYWPELATLDGAPVRMALDFLQAGAPSWDIDVDTDAGQLSLTLGGSAMQLDGRPVPMPASEEYPALYAHFAQLVRDRSIDADVAPLQLVADAFLCGRRTEVEPFVD